MLFDYHVYLWKRHLHMIALNAETFRNIRWYPSSSTQGQ